MDSARAGVMLTSDRLPARRRAACTSTPSFSRPTGSAYVHENIARVRKAAPVRSRQEQRS